MPQGAAGWGGGAGAAEQQGLAESGEGGQGGGGEQHCLPPWHTEQAAVHGLRCCCCHCCHCTSAATAAASGCLCQPLQVRGHIQPLSARWRAAAAAAVDPPSSPSALRCCCHCCWQPGRVHSVLPGHCLCAAPHCLPATAPLAPQLPLCLHPAARAAGASAAAATAVAAQGCLQCCQSLCPAADAQLPPCCLHSRAVRVAHLLPCPPPCCCCSGGEEGHHHMAWRLPCALIPQHHSHAGSDSTCSSCCHLHPQPLHAHHSASAPGSHLCHAHALLHQPWQLWAWRPHAHREGLPLKLWAQLWGVGQQASSRQQPVAGLAIARVQAPIIGVAIAKPAAGAGGGSSCGASSRHGSSQGCEGCCSVGRGLGVGLHRPGHIDEPAIGVPVEGHCEVAGSCAPGGSSSRGNGWQPWRVCACCASVGGGGGVRSPSSHKVPQGAALWLAKGRAAPVVLCAGLWAAAHCIHSPGKVKVPVQVHASVAVLGGCAGGPAVLARHVGAGVGQVVGVGIRVAIGPQHHPAGVQQRQGGWLLGAGPGQQAPSKVGAHQGPQGLPAMQQGGQQHARLAAPRRTRLLAGGTQAVGQQRRASH